jgi:AmiR/NasT family two-component response regulator
MENTEYYYDIASGNWRVMERLEETVKELKKEVTTRNPLGEAKALKIFENFIASLK